MIIRTAALLVVLATPVAASAQQSVTPLDRAGWLAGCWEGMSGRSAVEERWSPARAGTMVGTARAFRGDSTVTLELSVLRARGDTLRYEAHPVGQGPAVFKSTGTDASDLVFNNPEHDFPQRVRYRRVTADSVHASVEGPMDGQWRSIDYHMRRVRCDS